MSEESWKPVVGYEDYYSVSDLGRVRRERGGKRTYAGATPERQSRPAQNLGFYFEQTIERRC